MLFSNNWLTAGQTAFPPHVSDFTPWLVTCMKHECRMKLKVKQNIKHNCFYILHIQNVKSKYMFEYIYIY